MADNNIATRTFLKDRYSGLFCVVDDGVGSGGFNARLCLLSNL